MQNKPKLLPQVKLIPLGDKASEGTVDVEFLSKIYAQATEKQLEHFDPPTHREIKLTSESGFRQWFAIEVEDGKIVGAAAVNLRVRRNHELIKKYGFNFKPGELLRIFIFEDYKAKGYGKAASNALMDFALGKGFKRANVEIRMTNTRSRKLADALEFRRDNFGTALINLRKLVKKRKIKKIKAQFPDLFTPQRPEKTPKTWRDHLYLQYSKRLRPR